MRAGLAVFACMAALVIPAAVALGSDAATERAEYVARAEPVCKANVLANKRIFQGAKQEVKKGELKPAAQHFFRAGKAFAKTIGQLAAIPRPPADAARLTRWIELLNAEKAIIEKIGRALAAGEKHQAESYSVDLNRNSNKANNTVLGFGFEYCRIEPSRFG